VPGTERPGSRGLAVEAVPRCKEAPDRTVQHARAGWTMLPAMATKPPGTRPIDVLVVDEEKNIRATLRMFLEGIDAKPVEAATLDAAKAAVLRQSCDLAFVDLRLGEANGLTLIPELLKGNPLMDVVVITAYGTIEN